MIKVIFFGNSDSMFSNCHFQALIETPCKLVGVVDAPPSKRTSTSKASRDSANFVKFANEHGITVFAPSSVNISEFVRGISDLSPDLFIAVGYTNLLKEQILSVPSMLSVNFHASLLPAYRGKHPIFWALRNDERWAGLTVHVIDTGLDTGDILYQVKLLTRKNDSVDTLYSRIMKRSVKLISRLIEDAKNGAFRRMPQSEIGASYYSSVSEEDFRIDWSWNAEKIHRWIRTSPDQCFWDIKGHKIFFLDAEVDSHIANLSPGVVIKIGRKRCTIATGKGMLILSKVRMDSHCEIYMAELCQKLGLQEGSYLESAEV